MWQGVLDGIAVRARGHCEIGGPTCTGRGTEGHHRLPQSKGGRDVPSNSIWTCANCHQHIHRNPRWATEHGFLEGVVR